MPHTLAEKPASGPAPRRLFALDVLRTLACFLVIWQHAVEPYYINADGTVSSRPDVPLLGWLNSLTPIEVPLFVIISGYFLLPLRGGATAFMRRRLGRVLLPFVVWCAVYAVYFVPYRGDSWQACLLNVLHISVNFGTQVGHLWFVYMLLGLYLLVPVISPWLAQCSRRQLRAYLVLWGFTTLLPYVHLWFPEVLGECFWNPTPLLHYFTGFGGYFVLGHYVRRYGPLRVAYAVPLLVGGYLFTALVFAARLPHVSLVPDLEVGWRFCSLNIALMAWAVCSLCCRLRWQGGGVVGRFVSRFAVASYGVYCVHIIVLNAVRSLLCPLVPDHVAVAVPLTAVCTFVACYLVVRLLGLLPGASRWLGV